MRPGRSLLFILGIAAVLDIHDAGADEFDLALKTFLGLPQGAEIIWPPRQHVSPGAMIDPNGNAVEFAGDEVTIEERGVDKLEIELPSDRLGPPDAFWEWRLVLREKEGLTFKLALADVEKVRSLSENGPRASKAHRRVETAWRGSITVEARPKLEFPRERWNALRSAILAGTNEDIVSGASNIRMKLTKGTTIAVQSAPRPIAKDGPLKRPRSWALATIASGKYTNLSPLNQDWNKESADLVHAALLDWSPAVARKLAPQDDAGIRREQVLAFLDDFMRAAKRGKAELLVVYYIGHMERAGTGALSLLMGDAPAERLVRPPVPDIPAGNLRDLMQIVDQAEAELAPRQGSLDVAVMHRQIGVSKIPFVLLVDGCLEDPSYATARMRLGILVDARGGQPVYVGPGDAGTALRQTLVALNEYPKDFPWLKSKDVTILGATPGTLAYKELHPFWMLGAPVGPIAKRLVSTAARTRWDKDRPSLIRLLSYSADRQSIGPQELSGTVSWSDWLPHLKKFDPLSFKQ